MKKSRRFGKKKRAKAFIVRKRHDVIDSSLGIPSDLDVSSEVPSDFYDSDLESSFGDDHFGRFLQYQVARVVLHKPPDNNFIHFCLASYHLLGPKAYAVRGKAFKWIPVDILMRIFEDINFRAGVNHKLNQLIHLKFELARESDKLCTLSIDEMMLKRQLHYDEKEDMIIGFEDNGTERTPRIARFVTFFSLRGLFGEWKMPVAYFFTPEPSTPQGLKAKLLAVLNSLENYEIKVCAVIVHCWDYYRLIQPKVQVTLEDALQFSLERINANFSNYSSWHFRSTLRKLDETCIDSELTLVQNAVFTDPADSSAWFYLRWVLSNPGITEERKKELLNALDQLEELEPDCKWIIMAKCWLTGSLCLNDKTYIDNRVKFYKQLIKLDPMRKGQYEDYLRIAEEKDKQAVDQST